MKNKILFYIILILMIFPSIVIGADVTIGIEEKLGNTIPLDLTFTDEEGQTIVLRDLFDKPVILALVYYRCPGICTPLLNELQTVVDKVDLKPGEDFRIITISFDPNETSEVAKKKRLHYLELMEKKKNFPLDSWRFLVGSKESIAKLTDAVGFRYEPEKNEYKHAGALTILSPEGKIARYLFGLRYLPFDLKMAVVEASEGRVGPTIAKVLQYCFSYDPVGKKYALNVVKISGLVIIFFIAIFIGFLLFSKKLMPVPRQQQA